MIMYINKKDLINSINNCEHSDKNEMKSNKKKGDNMNIKESEKEEKSDDEQNIGDYHECE